MRFEHHAPSASSVVNFVTPPSRILAIRPLSVIRFVLSDFTLTVRSGIPINGLTCRSDSFVQVRRLNGQQCRYRTRVFAKT